MLQLVRRAFPLGVAVALICGALLGSIGTASASSDPGACYRINRTVNGQQLYKCRLYRGNVPVVALNSPGNPIVGTLNVGGYANWFVSQCQHPDFHDGGAANFWWAYTEADNGQWGWVSLVYFKGGIDYQGSAVLPNTNECPHPRVSPRAV
jgi:hypothetical protein